MRWKRIRRRIYRSKCIELIKISVRHAYTHTLSMIPRIGCLWLCAVCAEISASDNNDNIYDYCQKVRPFIVSFSFVSRSLVRFVRNWFLFFVVVVRNEKPPDRVADNWQVRVCVCCFVATFLSITFNLCPFARWWRRRHRQRWWCFAQVCFLYSCFSFFKFKLALCLCGCHLRLNFWINFSHELGEVHWRMLARVIAKQQQIATTYSID